MAIKKKNGKRPVRANVARSVHPLALALRQAGTTQAWLAKESGVSLPTINRVLNGRFARFSPESAFKILEVVPVTWGLDITDLVRPA